MAFLPCKKEQELHKMATVEIPTSGRGEREAACPFWSETRTWLEYSMQVLQSSR